MTKDPEERYMPRGSKPLNNPIKVIIEKKVGDHKVILGRFERLRVQPYVICIDNTEDTIWAVCLETEESGYATFIAIDVEIVKLIEELVKAEYEHQAAQNTLTNALLNKVLFAKERRLKEKQQTEKNS